MSFCSGTGNYLWTSIEIFGREVLLFLEIDYLKVKAFKNWPNFLTVKFF